MGFGNLQRFLKKSKNVEPVAKQIFITPEPQMGATITAVPQTAETAPVQPIELAVTPTIDGSEDLRIEPVVQTNAEHGMFAGTVQPLVEAQPQTPVVSPTASVASSEQAQVVTPVKKKFSLHVPSVRTIIQVYYKKALQHLANVRRGVHVYKLIITSAFAFVGFTGVFVYLTIRMSDIPELQQYQSADLPAVDLRPIALARTLTVEEKYEAYITLQTIPRVAELLAVVNQTSELQADTLRDHPAMAKDAQKRTLEQINILQEQLRLQKNFSDEHIMQITSFGEQNSLKAPDLDVNSPQYIAMLATKAYLDPSPEALIQSYALYNIAAILGQAESSMIVAALDPLGLQKTDEFAIVLEQKAKELGLDLNLIVHASAPTPEPVPEPVPAPTPEPEIPASSESSAQSSEAISSSSEQVSESSEQSSSLASQSSSVAQNVEINLPPNYSESSASSVSSVSSVASSEEQSSSVSSEESLEPSSSSSSPSNLKPNKRFFRACGASAQSDETLCTLP
jgi:hypothetical protein